MKARPQTVFISIIREHSHNERSPIMPLASRGLNMVAQTRFSSPVVRNFIS